MKPFVRYTALVLGLVFLVAASIACVDLIRIGAAITDPLWKAAAGFLTTAAIFLSLGFRGMRFRRRERSTGERQRNPGTL